MFLDAAILSAHAKAPWGDPPISDPPVHVSFVDWIPGICSLLGYMVINLIDKDRIRGDEGFGDSRAVWRARLFLFIGFALMAGGLAGSVVRLLFLFLDFQNAFVLIIAFVIIDCPCPQIHPERISRTVHVLRLRQCVAECRSHAFGHRSLVRSEYKQRIRV